MSTAIPPQTVTRGESILSHRHSSSNVSSSSLKIRRNDLASLTTSRDIHIIESAAGRRPPLNDGRSRLNTIDDEEREDHEYGKL